VVNKDIPPGKLAVGMPARVIRDSPGRTKRGENERRNETEG
jgi:acetyltransferase-like isoleucine patch superfamily enzyme